MGKQFLEKIKSKIKKVVCCTSGKSIVHILHIGKTGGSAVKQALEPCTQSANFIIELHDHSFSLKDVPEGEKVVFFLRDPVKRFVSGFYSRKRKGQPRYNIPWTPEEKDAFGQFDTPNELALSLSSTSGKVKASAENAMKGIKHVNSSYWDWFGDMTYFSSRISDILFIGFQENLDENFTKLLRILNLPSSVTLSGDKVIAHKNPNHLDTHLEPEAIQNLKVWYKKDYSFYNYCRQKAEEINNNN